jgi:hypothetical protein
MENIIINSPYKIIPSKHKRYTAHYEIPSAESVVVPKKKYGDQILCDVVWKDESNEIHRKADLMFDSVYIEPLNAMKDFILFGLWENSDKEIPIK